MPKTPAFSKPSFSSRKLLLFALLFGLIGGYVIYRSFAAPNPNLPGDLNSDNIVNVSDLSILLNAYGTTNTNADINADGIVNILDLSILLNHYGQSYTPGGTSCSTSTTAWQNSSITTQTGSFTTNFNVIPNGQAVDGVTGFSNGPASAYANLAAIIGFNSSNLVDAINGSNYSAVTSLSYTAGQTYAVRMTINMSTHTFSAYVTPPGAAEVTIANNYAFRSEQAAATQLSNWALISTVGSHQVCSLTISGSISPPPPPPSGTVRDVYASQSILNAINASAGGDTVKIHAGSYPLLQPTKSFSTPLNVVGESGVVIAGIILSNVAGYDFSYITSSIAPDTTCCNASAFYINAHTGNIILHNSKLFGGFTTLKFYSGGDAQSGWSYNINIHDNDISGGADDVTHVDCTVNTVIEHNFLHDPTITAGNHQDGIQSQCSNGLQILRNTFSTASQPVSNGSTANSQGIIFGEDSSFPNRLISNSVISNNLIAHWNIGRPVQLLDGIRGVKFVNNTVTDGGGAGLSLTLGSGALGSSGIEIWNNILDDAYFNNGSGAVAFYDTNWFVVYVRPGMSGTNSYTGAPGFIDTTSYALSTSGGAYTKGLTRTGTPTLDIDNNTRPNPPALGARL